MGTWKLQGPFCKMWRMFKWQKSKKSLTCWVFFFSDTLILVHAKRPKGADFVYEKYYGKIRIKKERVVQTEKWINGLIQWIFENTVTLLKVQSWKMTWKIRLILFLRLSFERANLSMNERIDLSSYWSQTQHELLFQLVPVGFSCCQHLSTALTNLVLPAA